MKDGKIELSPPHYQTWRNSQRTGETNKQKRQRYVELYERSSGRSGPHGVLRSENKRQKHGRRGLPKGIKPMERFFASFFMSAFSEVAKSNESDELRRKVMAEACARADLPSPSTLPSSDQSSRELYSTRASLVLEEARCILSGALSRKRRENFGVGVCLHSVEERKKTGFWVLSFEKAFGSFTSNELYDMRPGGCFQIVPPSSGENTSLESSLLGSIVPQFDFHKTGPNNSLSLLVYQKGTHTQNYLREGWTVVHVTTLISQVRQFEACICAKKVAFLPELLAWKDMTQSKSDHYACDGEDEAKEDENDGDDEVIARGNADGEEMATGACNSGRCANSPHLQKSPFSLPTLNSTQERAVDEFLDSPPSTLKLVQGPPGTGKTTFMVSLVAKSLLRCSPSGKRRRILVAAPTNKAIGVLATRFLDALKDDTCFNIVMIGVEDKLVSDREDYADGDVKRGDDPFTISSLSSKLRQTFVYTWKESRIREFEKLRHGLSHRETAKADVMRANQLMQKLVHSIPKAAKSVLGITDLVHQFVISLENGEGSLLGSSNVDTAKSSIFPLNRLISDLIGVLVSIDQSTLTPEILDTADVIFCTLSTAGISAMKKTRRIDDFFVDEAAAATEPEMYIPFHLMPSRMLAVGDPKQLPAMVTSKHAMAMGLAKSLHERLMFDCHKEHIMLDVQYRMNPSISSFPSQYFYSGKLVDGSNVTSPDYNANIDIPNKKSYSFIQVDGCERQQAGGSYSNVDEAVAAVKLVKMFHRSSLLQESGSNNSTLWHDPDKIRIITFYQGQVVLIKRMLSQAGLGQVLVTTVDSSQGCEADIVILSFVRSNTECGNVRCTVGFLTDDRRMNVALTRARHQLVCIGNARGTLSRSGAVTLKAIVDDAEKRDCISTDILKISPNPGQNDNRMLKVKEGQLALYKRLAASKNATLLDKKKSLQMVISLTKEINEIKQHYLESLKELI